MIGFWSICPSRGGDHEFAAQKKHQDWAPAQAIRRRAMPVGSWMDHTRKANQGVRDPGTYLDANIKADQRELRRILPSK